ncbi:MAG: TRAP transporter large permease subunit, partial [Chloroflexota bacterium]
GVFPGLLLAALYILYVAVRAFLQPSLAPALPEAERMIPLRQKARNLTTLIAPGFLVTIVLGSIFLGVATPTESAAIGAVGAIVCAAIRRQFSWQSFTYALWGTTKVTCMILWVAFGASAFIAIYGLAGGAEFVQGLITGLPLGPWGIFIMVQVLLFFMGMFFDWIAILLLAGPIVFPIMAALGFDMVWFGAIFVMNMQMSYLTPPIGPALVYIKGVVPPEITMGHIIRSIWPFLILQMIGLGLVAVFPQIALWLPSIMIR